MYLLSQNHRHSLAQQCLTQMMWHMHVSGTGMTFLETSLKIEASILPFTTGDVLTETDVKLMTFIVNARLVNPFCSSKT